MKSRNQYQFNPKPQHADIIQSPFGSYYIALNRETRDQFRQVLRTCFECFFLDDEGATAAPTSTKWEQLQRSTSLMDELARQADEVYYRNDDQFDCLICGEATKKGEGILFRQCLHPCCRNCVLQLIKTSEDPMIKCPHDDCAMLLEERELRGVRILKENIDVKRRWVFFSGRQRFGF